MAETPPEGKLVIHASNVSRSFSIHHEKNMTVFLKLASFFERNKQNEKLVVLDNISLDVRKGEMLGVIGRNGSGKTTLLKILGKVMHPSSGKVELYGKVSSFISLGTGLQQDLTARENIVLYGMILGESKENMKRKADAVIKFAELENFGDVRIKDFSTGMLMRLAFSTALFVEPDIILVDEVLSVGDIAFQQKSFNEFLKMRKSGKTVVFVSHNLDQVAKLCDRVIFIDKGRIAASGEPKKVVAEYMKMMEPAPADGSKTAEDP